MRLRDYQSAASDATFEAWNENPSALVVLPTGAGKTILFAHVINRHLRNAFPRKIKAMVLAHRQELIFQAKEKIERATGLRCEVEMGDYRSQSQSLAGATQVIVSSIQTQCAGGDGGGRMGKFDPSEFGLLIIDEAHHACATSYRRVIDYYRTNPNLKVLGVTATPDRADEAALGQVFDSVAFDYEILDAIHDGWLVPIQQQMVHVEDFDLSSVRTTAGDLNGADLAAVLESEKNLQGMAGPSLEIIGNRRALVFTSSVKCAQTLCEIFNRHRNGMAAWVCGKTPKTERQAMLAQFASGKVQVVVNCAVLTEGFDDPGVEVVIMGRPTKSRSLYAQMVGRSTRPIAGVVDGPETPELRRQAIADSSKPSCLVVDFVGNSGKHKLISSADILGGKVSDEAIERALLRVKSAKKPMAMSEVLDEEQSLIDAEREQRRIEEEARKSKLVASVKYSKQDVDPFDVLQIQPTPARGWDDGKQLSEKQRGFLTRSGIDPDSLEYHKAKQIIGDIMHRRENNLCSFKQAKILSKYGYATDVSFEQASKTIDAVAKAGWKRVEIPSTVPAVESDNIPF